MDFKNQKETIMVKGLKSQNKQKLLRIKLFRKNMIHLQAPRTFWEPEIVTTIS